MEAQDAGAARAANRGRDWRIVARAAAGHLPAAADRSRRMTGLVQLRSANRHVLTADASQRKLDAVTELLRGTHGTEEDRR